MYLRRVSVRIGTAALIAQAVAAQLVQQPQLPGSAIAQWQDPLPPLHVSLGLNLTLEMREFQSPVMPTGFVPAAGAYTGTWVWGYRDAAGNPETSYIGPVVRAQRNVPTRIRWRNMLPHTSASNLTAWLASTDTSIHWADPMQAGMGMANYAGSIPTVPHLHGAELPPQLDGGPEQFFTSDGVAHGADYYSMVGAAANEAIYRYPNTQEATTLWFHDHALGITRLSVTAGLAGVYQLGDLFGRYPRGLSSFAIDSEPTIPLVIQDRSFDINGQLYFDNAGINPDLHPFWVPEFLGDTIVVNGKVWPTFGTQAAPKAAKRYRFAMVNGSNARTYELFFEDPVTGLGGPPMWIIGTDGGLLDLPVRLDPSLQQKLLVMPGERYDVVVDFNDTAWRLANPNFSGQLILRNTGNTPYPGGDAPDPATTGQILKCFIGAAPTRDRGYDPASGIALRTPMVRLANPTTGTANVAANVTRQLTLNEVIGPGGPVEVLVNNTKWDGLSVATDVFAGGVRPDMQLMPFAHNNNWLSETPTEGTVELWEVVNISADAHPLHLHLVQFQLMNREDIDAGAYIGLYDSLFPASSAIDPQTGAPFPGGVYIGGYGPPGDYRTANPAKLGGNPAVEPFLLGNVTVAKPQEAGWKDTLVVMPGQVTRFIVRYAPLDTPLTARASQKAYAFDPNGGLGYVLHCHILDHEDNEMMRPNFVLPNPQAPAPNRRRLRLGRDY